MSIIKIGDLEIGGDRVIIIAGPCALENEEQALRITRIVKGVGAQTFRAQIFKPRTDPDSFQGLGLAGLPILALLKRETGLLLITEVLDPRDIEKVCDYCDILQIGSRSMQNFPLLIEAGKTGKPVMLKRGMGATIQDYLSAAKYITNQGNQRLILCERGIVTFEGYTRNTLDINGLMALKDISGFPVFIDPSHGTGRREMVVRAALAGIAAGADGVMVEVHYDPDSSLVDAKQTISSEQFSELMEKGRSVAEAIGRSM